MAATLRPVHALFPVKNITIITLAALYCAAQTLTAIEGAVTRLRACAGRARVVRILRTLELCKIRKSSPLTRCTYIRVIPDKGGGQGQQ